MTEYKMEVENGGGGGGLKNGRQQQRVVNGGWVMQNWLSATIHITF